MDPRPPRSIYVETFAIPGTLTPPGGVTVPASVVWLDARPAVGTLTAGLGVGSASMDLRRRLVLRKDQVGAEVLSGSVLTAPELAEGVAEDWRVDRVDSLDAEIHRVVVSRVPVP